MMFVGAVEEEAVGMIAGRLGEGLLTGGDGRVTDRTLRDYRPYATRTNQEKCSLGSITYVGLPPTSEAGDDNG